MLFKTCINTTYYYIFILLISSKLLREIITALETLMIRWLEYVIVTTDSGTRQRNKRFLFQPDLGDYSNWIPWSDRMTSWYIYYISWTICLNRWSLLYLIKRTSTVAFINQTICHANRQFALSINILLRSKKSWFVIGFSLKWQGSPFLT